MQENRNSHNVSSFEESSYFFDELNRDETALHNCNSVNAYNLWPKIINNGKLLVDIDSDDLFEPPEKQRDERINKAERLGV
jgi:hypothetical protein